VTQYVLSEDADRDLDGIWDYIALQCPSFPSFLW
jgi:plasmid stabilization system protein ParE